MAGGAARTVNGMKRPASSPIKLRCNVMTLFLPLHAAHPGSVPTAEHHRVFAELQTVKHFVTRTAIGVGFRLDDLRHEHRTEHAGSDDRVHVVGQLVGDAEGIRDVCGDADGHGQHHRTHET